MMTDSNLSSDDIKFINAYIRQRANSIESVVKQTAELLSDMTKYTSMVLSPQLKDIRLKHIQIVALNDSTAIVVIITDTGLTRKRSNTG